MIEERGRVVAVEGPYAWVEASGGGACGTCAARAGCGTASLQAWLGRRRRRVRALNRAGARPGDEVVVGLAEGALLRGSVLVYLTPLAGLLAGGLAAALLAGPADGPAAAGALAGGAAGLLWGRARLRRAASDPCFQPVVLRRA